MFKEKVEALDQIEKRFNLNKQDLMKQIEQLVEQSKLQIKYPSSKIKTLQDKEIEELKKQIEELKQSNDN